MTAELRVLFAKEASRWGEEHPGEGERLAGEVLYWASSVSAAGHAGDAGDLVVEQIQNVAQRNGVSPEEVIEQLFSAETAEDVMLLFQVA
ncbi:hypothetical protein GTO10_04500 [Candidatus Saccharibacteria bacterium]|nr:hypothetical protein [Candidatus Saccharibacteria bacterium]